MSFLCYYESVRKNMDIQGNSEIGLVITGRVSATNR